MRPAAIARRLREKHGRHGAIRRAHERCQRYRRLEEGEAVVTHAFRWLVWTTVLAQLLGTTQSEVIASMHRHLHLVRSAA